MQTTLISNHDPVPGVLGLIAKFIGRDMEVRANRLRRLAEVELARLNGWTVSLLPFGPEDIGRSDLSGQFPTTNPWDHPICFLDRKGRAVALAGQPYSDNRIWDAVADEHGLGVSIPPNPRASIHNPGSCYFAIVHPPGVPVTWLAEQLNDVRF